MSILTGFPFPCRRDLVKIEATIVEKAKSPKVIVFKKKRRKGYKRTQGTIKYTLSNVEPVNRLLCGGIEGKRTSGAKHSPPLSTLSLQAGSLSFASLTADSRVQNPN